MISRFFSVKNIAFLAGVIILLFIIPKIAGIVMLFYAAYVIACALDPFVEKFQNKLKNNRTLASIIVVFGGILAIFALFAPIIAIAYNEIRTFIRVFPDKIADVASYIINLRIYGHNLSDIVNFNSIFDTNPDFAQSVFSQSWNITMGIFQFFMLTKKLLELKLQLVFKHIKNFLEKILEEFGFLNVDIFQKLINT